MQETTITTPCERTIQVKTTEIGSGLRVYSRTSSISEILPNGARKEIGTETTQGVVDEDNREWLEIGETEFEHFTPISYPSGQFAVPIFVTRSGRERMRREGNPLAAGNLCKLMVAAGMLFDGKGETFVALAEKGMTSDDLLFVSLWDNSIVDAFGRPVPLAHEFDYLNGHLEEESYDLEKVCEVLAAHPEVEIVPDRSGSLIGFIPGYNATRECSRHVTARWTPSDESWAVLLAAAGFDPEKPEPVRIDAALMAGRADVLGINECRLAKDYRHGF